MDTFTVHASKETRSFIVRNPTKHNVVDPPEADLSDNSKIRDCEMVRPGSAILPSDPTEGSSPDSCPHQGVGCVRDPLGAIDLPGSTGDLAYRRF